MDEHRGHRVLSSTVAGGLASDVEVGTVREAVTRLNRYVRAGSAGIRA